MSLNAIPVSKKKYVSIADFFDMLGQHIYGGKWTGEEITVNKIVSYEEASQLVEEEREKTSKIQARYGSADDAKLKEIDFHTDEVDGHDIYLTNPKEYQLRVMVSQLRSIRSLISDLPSLDDRENYNLLRAAYLRKQDISEKASEMLAQGLLKSFSRTPEGREEMPSNFWASKSLEINFSNSSAKTSSKKFSDIEIISVDAKESLRDLCIISFTRHDLLKSAYAAKI